jgi:hypothetical protein
MGSEQSEVQNIAAPSAQEAIPLKGPIWKQFEVPHGIADAKANNARAQNLLDEGTDSDAKLRGLLQEVEPRVASPQPLGSVVQPGRLAAPETKPIH